MVRIDALYLSASQLFDNRYELYYGKKADANFCVSRAMREELAENWGVRYTYSKYFFIALPC